MLCEELEVNIQQELLVHIFHIGVAPIFLDTISQCMMILPWFFLLSLDTLSIDSVYYQLIVDALLEMWR